MARVYSNTTDFLEGSEALFQPSSGLGFAPPVNNTRQREYKQFARIENPSSQSQHLGWESKQLTMQPPTAPPQSLPSDSQVILGMNSDPSAMGESLSSYGISAPSAASAAAAVVISPVIPTRSLPIAPQQFHGSRDYHHEQHYERQSSPNIWRSSGEQHTIATSNRNGDNNNSSSNNKNSSSNYNNGSNRNDSSNVASASSTPAQTSPSNAAFADSLNSTSGPYAQWGRKW